VKPVIEAMKDNSTAHSMTFIHRGWDRQELNLLVDCLTQHNTGIRYLVFESLVFTLQIAEAVVKILKSNPRIKAVTFISELPSDCFSRFCDGLEYYHIESLRMEIIKTTANLRKLTEGVQWNQTLTELSLRLPFPEPGMFEEFCNIFLASPTISSFNVSWFDRHITEDDYNCFAKVLKTNRLKQLTFNCERLDLTFLAEEFKNSSALESLTLQFSNMDIKLLGEIINSNKSIKKFNMEHLAGTEQIILDLHLEQNTSLEQLSITYWALNGGNLFKMLANNKTLKSLTIGTSSALDVVGLQEFLKENTSLTELVLPPSTNNEQHTCTYLANGLKFNTSLRKLTMDGTYQDHTSVIKFLNELKHNRSLTHLFMGPIRAIGMLNRTFYNEEDNTLDVIFGLVRSNKTLRYIEGAKEISYLEAKLKENRDEQDQIISNTCLWIKMILLKPNSFILPIEVWSNIFKYASHSFVPFDFEQFFKDSMAK
jgi:hypothetical protein